MPSSSSKVEVAISFLFKEGGDGHPHFFVRRVEVAFLISSKAGGGGHPICSSVGVGIPISSKEGEQCVL